MSQQHQNKTALQQYMCTHIKNRDVWDILSRKILDALCIPLETSFGINSRGVINLVSSGEIIQENDYPIINETFNKYIQDKKRALINRLLVIHFCNCFDSSTSHFIRLKIMSHLN